MNRLAICAIFKNEGPFLLEWIAYHHAVGFDHFFLYDNDSNDGGSTLIQCSPFANLTSIIPWPMRAGQLPAYRHFIENHARACDWVAFIDVDEFVVPLTEPTVGHTLERLTGFSAVMVSWRIFGPSAWSKRPTGLVIENYMARTPDHFPANQHVKSIVRASDLLDVTQNPHEFVVRGAVCNAAGEPIANVAIQPSAHHQGLVINHYQTRSRQDWAEKIHRGSAMFDVEGPVYAEDLVEHYEAMSTVWDDEITRFAPRVKELLGGETIGAPAVSTSAEWVLQPPDGFQRADGLALVFSDRSGHATSWMAGLRGRAAQGLLDPEFLADEAGRIYRFESSEAARNACDAELEDHGPVGGETLAR
jgi:hypothetical protein